MDDNSTLISRRRFNQGLLAGAASLALGGCSDKNNTTRTSIPELKLSVSQWTLHKKQFGGTFSQYEQWQKWLQSDPKKVLQGTLSPMEFPEYVNTQFGFEAVDFVNTFYFQALNDSQYWKELNTRCADNGIVMNNMMLDQLGYLGHKDDDMRKQSVEAHKRWIAASAELGCLSVRINVHGIGDWQTQLDNALASAVELADFAKQQGIVLLIENHGGLSSNGEWLLALMQQANHSNLQLMLDYDNFKWSETEIWQTAQVFDRYKGVKMLIPYAHSISVKTYDFDDVGNETTIDIQRMVKLAQKSNFQGYHSVEYEGGEQEHLSIHQGIEKTRDLLKRVWV